MAKEGRARLEEEWEQNQDKDKTSAVRDKLNKRSQQQPDRPGGAGTGIAHNKSERKKDKNNGIDNV